MASVAVTPTMPGTIATPPSYPGGLKRKRVLISNDDDSAIGSSQADIPSSPTKKLKVSFNLANNVTHVMEDWNEKGVQLVREEVRRALRQHRAGDSAEYDQLREHFALKRSATGSPSSNLLRKYLMALSAHANLLDKSCNGLVKEVLDHAWIGRDDKFLQAFYMFLSTLLNAYSGYARLVLDTLVVKLVEIPGTAGRLLRSTGLSIDQLLSRVHRAIKLILDSFPSTNTVLFGVLADTFPHPSDQRKVHVEYAQSLLKLITYAPGMTGSVLSLLMDRLVKLDTSIQKKLDELDAGEEELEDAIWGDSAEGKRTPSEAALSDAGSVAGDTEYDSEDSDADSEESDDDLDDEQRQWRDFKENVRRLDAMLDLLFGYYDKIFSGKDSRGAQIAFDQILSHFDKIILPDRSRYVQFLIFRYAQSSPQYAAQFVQTCQRIVDNQTRPPLIRAFAAAYLASFVARGKNVSSDLVCSVVASLGSRLEEKRLVYEKTARGPDLSRYSTYYATMQAILYIICFRWKDLLVLDEDEDEDEQIEQITLRQRQGRWSRDLKAQLHSSVHSVLNPLKVIAPVIVKIFSQIATHLDLIYCHTIIERNRRFQLTHALYAATEFTGRSSAISGGSLAKLQLEEYFPFDPYQLPRSKRWVDGSYKAWESPSGMEDDAAPPNSSDNEEEAYDGEDYQDDTETESQASV